LCYSVSLPRLVIVSDMTQTCEKQLSTVSRYRPCHHLTTDVSSTRKDMTTGASDVNSRCCKWTCALSYVSRVLMQRKLSANSTLLSLIQTTETTATSCRLDDSYAHFTNVQPSRLRHQPPASSESVLWIKLPKYICSVILWI